jgi:protein transport protein SEC13
MSTTMSISAETAVPSPIYVDAQHDDLVHDAQMDFYGAKLATCSSGMTAPTTVLYDVRVSKTR